MFRKKEVVAMLLAGGQGSRLGVLTNKLAKPAVPFGGKYRIIDFPLSNCTNSGIDTVGVLTQYQPLILNEYIGNGQPWDLDKMYGGVHVLPPYQRSKGGDWYKGTANAIQQNIAFIDRYNPEYVLVLSGDHIYKMDYAKMVAAHKEKNADCTIAVIEVPWEEASRFGILNTNDDGSIYEFDEKPKKPKSNNASMGIYVFTWSKLRTYLEADEGNPKSSNDFGADVLPAMLKAGEKMYAHKFDGYWKDVGTIESLWESNIDMLNPRAKMDLSEEYFRIYTRDPVMPPHFVGENANVENSIVAEGCSVLGKVDGSVLFAGVEIAPTATVNYSILMPGVKVEDGAVIEYAIISENTVIGKRAKIGEDPEAMGENRDQWGVAVVGDNLTIGDNVVVPPTQMVFENIGR